MLIVAEVIGVLVLGAAIGIGLSRIIQRLVRGKQGQRKRKRS